MEQLLFMVVLVVMQRVVKLDNYKLQQNHECSTYDYYRIDAYQDDLRIGRAGTTDFYIFQDGKVKVENNFEILDKQQMV